MREPAARLQPPGDRLLEALLELARSAIRNDRAALERRAKITVVQGGRRDAA